MPRNALPPPRRASEAALEALIDPGNAVTSGTNGTSGLVRSAVAPGSAGALVTRGTNDTSEIRETRDVRGNPDTPGSSNNAGTSGATSHPPREHVKIRRALADEMRDAVWFLTERGRPRVQLGELLDEAVVAWLTESQRQHNGGAKFPRRGRLR